MSQKIAIHKGKEPFPNVLWWKPFFAWQKQMNDTTKGIFPFFTPAAFWKEICDALQQNTNRMFTPW